ncbi:LysR family transcriptional regulator [Thalassospira sp.]|uniref:LysR family transcriptional regulator n=1 Tax=Thalassospira sp. TaxID=1912094 RepID=UPI002735815A|nr:LysR family transcriptional regulator [Thalassospira sp.]MDP2696902.1 LysR family transcriptional regulator [Thalassospira sp.]
MTFEQLYIFVAVAEREHLTRAAEAIHLTPSAVSSAIRNLENFYGVELFHRVGRRIELTESGRVFLGEARATLARVRAAELALAEMGGLKRGEIHIQASQTIAGYWLPPLLMQFHYHHPHIDLHVETGNTRTVADAVLRGTANIGFVEGEIEDPALAREEIGEDALTIVVGAQHPWADGRTVTLDQLVHGTPWILREAGSGTRSEFENALMRDGADITRLSVTMILPSNDAVMSAVQAGLCATAVSRLAASALIDQGRLVPVAWSLPPRKFFMLRHKERHHGKAAATLAELCRATCAREKPGLPDPARS